MKNNKEILKHVKPFLPEWRKLSNGESYSVNVYGYNVRFKLYWESDNTPSARIFGIYENDDFLMEKVIPNTPQYREFKKRISKFIKDTMEYGRKHFYNGDYLWDGYFWNVE